MDRRFAIATLGFAVWVAFSHAQQPLLDIKPPADVGPAAPTKMPSPPAMPNIPAVPTLPASPKPPTPPATTTISRIALELPPTSLSTPVPATPATPVVPSTMPMTSSAMVDEGVLFKFKPGDEHLLQMETSNGLFKFFVGGRLQIDAAWLSGSERLQAAPPRGVGDLHDAVNFRRARFDFGGTFYRNIDFLMEFDFINTVNAERNGEPLPVNTPVPTDLWVTFKQLPFIGNLRVGNQKPPVSFEHLTSSRYLNFLERSLAFDAFVENQNNGFEPGILAFDNALDQRMYWALGVFKHTRSIFGWNIGDGEYDLTGRLTGLPIWEQDGRYLVHVGVSGSFRGMDDGQDRMRARLLVRDGPAVLHNIVAEARMFGDNRVMIAPEFVTVWGPWTIQAEYYGNWVTNAVAPTDGPVAARRDNGTVFFNGGYAEVLYFFTGEHRTYDRGRAAFTRVTPKANFRGFGSGDGEACDGHGWGAWQLGVRYSWLDLDNNNIRGSSVQDLTVGLNWFLNPYMKVQWNYTLLHRNAFDPRFDGYIHGFGTRLAFDF